jgi:hypothetical protein
VSVAGHFIRSGGNSGRVSCLSKKEEWPSTTKTVSASKSKGTLFYAVDLYDNETCKKGKRTSTSRGSRLKVLHSSYHVFCKSTLPNPLAMHRNRPRRPLKHQPPRPPSPQLRRKRKRRTTGMPRAGTRQRWTRRSRERGRSRTR